MIKYIEGGVCAAKGFKASGIHCGIRKNKIKKDLSLIVSDCKASAAAVYTTNLVCGAHTREYRGRMRTRRHLQQRKCKHLQRRRHSDRRGYVRSRI